MVLRTHYHLLMPTKMVKKKLKYLEFLILKYHIEAMDPAYIIPFEIYGNYL